MQETVPNVILGFKKAMTFGPNYKSAVTGLLVLLNDATWHVLCNFETKPSVLSAMPGVTISLSILLSQGTADVCNALRKLREITRLSKFYPRFQSQFRLRCTSRGQIPCDERDGRKL